jgi:rubrerythrin
MIYLLIAIPLALGAGALWGYAAGVEMTERRLYERLVANREQFAMHAVEERHEARINAAKQAEAACLQKFEDYKTELTNGAEGCYVCRSGLYDGLSTISDAEEDERVRRWRSF